MCVTFFAYYCAIRTLTASETKVIASATVVAIVTPETGCTVLTNSTILAESASYT